VNREGARAPAGAYLGSAPVLKVFNNTEQQLSSLNNSYITLISKKSDAKLSKDFRPINVINGVQKILSKILALRLQPKMGSLIDTVQTDFIKGR
jgi:hypothetical protein